MTSTEQNVAEVRKALTTADREAAQAILDAEHKRPEGVRTTVIAAAGDRLAKLDAEEAEAAAASVAAQTPPEGTDTPPTTPEPADGAAAQRADTQQPAPVQTVKPAQPAKVKPAQYDDPSWNVGQYAPEPVVRVLDMRTGKYGKPRTGELTPGEAGEYVVQAGDTITAYVRTLLG